MRLGRGYVDMALFDLAGRSMAPSPLVFNEGSGPPLLASLVQTIEGFPCPEGAAPCHPIAPIACRGRWSATPAWSSTSPYYDLRNWPLGPTLQEAFSVPVLVSGDVRTWIQAERGGGRQNCADAVLVFVHNDIGVGMVVNGQLIKSEAVLLSGISATCSLSLRPALLLRRFLAAPARS